MGASTYTRTNVFKTIMGNKRISVDKVAITAYGTDGVPCAGSDMGMGTVDLAFAVLDVACDVSGGAVAAIWDPTNAAIKFLTAADTLCTAGSLVITAYIVAIGS